MRAIFIVAGGLVGVIVGVCIFSGSRAFKRYASNHGVATSQPGATRKQRVTLWSVWFGVWIAFGAGMGAVVPLHMS
jgi:hypothetical protein